MPLAGIPQKSCCGRGEAQSPGCSCCVWGQSGTCRGCRQKPGSADGLWRCRGWQRGCQHWGRLANCSTPRGKAGSTPKALGVAKQPCGLPARSGEPRRMFPGSREQIWEPANTPKAGSWVFRSGHVPGERNPPAPDSCAPFVSGDNRITGSPDPAGHNPPSRCVLCVANRKPSLVQKVKQLLAFMVISPVKYGTSENPKQIKVELAAGY